MSRDSTTAHLSLMTVITMLVTATSDLERVVLYRFLSDATERIPDIVSPTSVHPHRPQIVLLIFRYDNLLPRAISVLGNTSNPAIISSITAIINHAMTDPTYTFPADLGPMESTLSLNSHGLSQHLQSQTQFQQHQHGRSYSASISSVHAPTTNTSRGGSRGDVMLEDLGMRGLGEMSFNIGKSDR